MISGSLVRDVDVGPVTMRTWELGDGPPVVLLHGFPELAYSWRHQLPALAAAGRRAIAYDLRGFGASSAPEEIDQYHLRHLVADLVGLLDALDLARVDLVGHDWGSIVAMTATLRHPDRVRRLVSLNVPYRGRCCGFPPLEVIRERFAERFGYVLAFQEPGVIEASFAADPAGFLRRMYDGVAATDFLDDDEFEVYRDAFAAAGIAGPVNLYRNIDANWAWTADLADAPIPVPMLMIAAERDPVLPVRLVEGMDRWVPMLRTVTIADCGHWTQQERPDAVDIALTDFFDAAEFELDD